jgi:hypothetical protein
MRCPYVHSENHDFSAALELLAASVRAQPSAWRVAAERVHDRRFHRDVLVTFATTPCN